MRSLLTLKMRKRQLKPLFNRNLREGGYTKQSIQPARRVFTPCASRKKLSVSSSIHDAISAVLTGARTFLMFSLSRLSISNSDAKSNKILLDLLVSDARRFLWKAKRLAIWRKLLPSLRIVASVIWNCNNISSERV